MVAKKVKRKLNIKALLVLLLIIGLIGMFSYTFVNRRVKNIYIKNTSLILDNEIIEIAGIKNYPPIFKLNKNNLEKKIKTLELVNNVTIKKTLTGKLIIDIDEAKPILYNRNTEKVMLSNKKEVKINSKYLGIPTLINYVPTDILQDFVASLKKIDMDIIKMINEIEYKPDISNNVTIDDTRFLLRMNDGNLVYVNTINIKRLNDYKEFFAMIDNNRGTLFLDSYNSNNNLLGLFEYFDDKKNKTNKGEKQDGEN